MQNRPHAEYFHNKINTFLMWNCPNHGYLFDVSVSQTELGIQYFMYTANITQYTKHEFICR